MAPPAKLLTVGGSDSGGAAGVQADLKTWTALGVYGMSALTAVTAQNSAAVVAAHFLPPEFVAAQITAVLSDYGADAVKTGLIGRAETARAIADLLRGRPHVVVDPVLVNHRGEPMFDATLTAAYRAHLLPTAALVTPNLAEAALLIGRPIASVEEMAAAAAELVALGCRAALIKGWQHGGIMLDLLHDGANVYYLAHPWIPTANTHGSGDTLSAAIAAGLAQGRPLAAAVQRARRFTLRAIAAARAWQLGRGHGPLWHTLALGADG